jgi:tetratricopeptide (TPR) repeat protein
VNYISSRSELLSVLGVLIAFYLLTVKKEHQVWVLLSFGAALLAKSTALVLLPLLLVYECMEPPEWRRWRGHIPFWLLGFVYLGVIQVNGFLSRSLAQEVRPYEEQIWTQIKALVYYAKLLFMPVGLSVEHGFNTSRSLVDAAVLSSLALVLSLGYLALLGWRRRAWGSQAVLWCAAALGLTFAVPLNVLVNEHRLYLAMAGVLLGVLGYLDATRARRWRPWGCGLLLIMGVLTWQRNTVWQDDLTLWQDAVDKAPGMFRAQSNLGLAHYERGELDPARAAFERALELNPHYGKTWSNLGLVYEDGGLFERAGSAYRRALDLRPGLAGTHNNLGRLQLKAGKLEAARSSLEQALALDPFYAAAQVNLGLVHQRSGRWDEAVRAYEKALALDPDYAAAYNNLGLVYADQGLLEEGIVALQQAVHLQPDYREAQINLQLLELQRQGVPPGEAYERLLQRFPERAELWKALGDARLHQEAWEGAAAAYREALERGSGQVEVYASLAAAYRNQGQLTRAITTYEKALELFPRNPDLHNNLASAYAAAGRLEEAIQACRRVLEVDPDNRRAGSNLQKLLRAQAAGD